MGLLALDMASRSALGQDIHAFDSDMETPFHQQAKMILDHFLNTIAARVGFPFFLEKLRDCLGIDLSVTSSTHFFHGILETLYEQRKADSYSAQVPDLLQLMLNAEAEADNRVTDNDPQCLSKTELLAQCITFMAAGYETTGSLLQFSLYHIACLPEVQEQLQKEIDTVLAGSEHVTYEHVINMPYLSQSSSKVQFAGHYQGIPFEKGDLFVMPVYAMHHNATYYPDPEKFDPERLSPDSKASRDPMTYVPFGAGPRTCIGMRLSEFGTHTALAVLLRRYRFKPGTNSPTIPVEVVSKKLLLNQRKTFMWWQ
ncbi:Cytochrome P450 3A9 [Aphelenchoides avenae]|nr:Cytochrome P450 3A9 [Aphelenchus avenae]